MQKASYLCTRFIPRIALLTAAALLGGCGGSKLLKQPLPLTDTLEQPLAIAADDQLAVHVDQVVVQDGPGSWAKNAFWDEYRLTLFAANASPVSVQDISVIDAMGLEASPGDNRKALVGDSKDVIRQYRKQGIRLEVGAGGYGLAASTATAAVLGAGAGVVTASAGSAIFGALFGSAGASAFGSAAMPLAATGAIVLAAPVAIVGGVIKADRNRQVDEQIQARRIELPLFVEPQVPVEVTAFFPVAPGPSAVRIDYSAGLTEHSLMVSLPDSFTRLHFRDQPLPAPPNRMD